MEEITRSYWKTIQLYHPDRVLGLAPEIVELADRRTKALNAAYNEAKQRARCEPPISRRLVISDASK
jgi:DnaJ-class molecular chaperone